MISVGVGHDTSSFGLVIDPLSLKVAPRFELNDSVSTLFVLLKRPFVNVSVPELELTFSLFLSLNPITCVFFPSQKIVMLSLSVFMVVEPVSFVFVTIHIIVLSEAFFFAIFELPLIPVSFGINIDSFAMKDVVFPFSKVRVAAWKIKSSMSWTNSIFELSDVPTSISGVNRLHSRF